MARKRRTGRALLQAFRQSYQPVAKVVAAFDRPCIPADCVAIREGDHKGRPYMHPNRALSGGRRNGLDARETFTTGCYGRRNASGGMTRGREGRG